MTRALLIVFFIPLVSLPAAVPLTAREPTTSFDQIAPIFERRCFSCHNDRDRRGGLSLESAASLVRGGDSGEVVWAGDPESSYLLELIVPVDGRAAMPKNADPLTAAEIEAIRRWIAAGAEWPPNVKLEASRVTDTDWWSLRPLVRPAVPDSPLGVPVRNPIDAFIADKHRELKLAFSPEADRRTLIRRLYFDLTGLPPTPDEVEAFVADQAPDAYERLVDRLLSSPRYGERWARHWLDVVHFGETHGYDKDKPRPNAWPYRDYVIRSLNDDKPYGRFVAEQIAGDILFPDRADAIEALGFIAAGPWDLIGHAEVPETKLDGRIARHLDRDDMVQNTIVTFNSMTIGCGQCHHHKFDPITMDDYYSLQAVFAALDRADLPYDPDPETAAQRQRLVERRRILTGQQQSLETRIQELGGPELRELDRLIAAAGKPAEPVPPEHGYHSRIEPTADREKWVQVDLGQSRDIVRIETIACHDDFAAIGAGFGFPVRYKVEASDDADFRDAVRQLVDRTEADFPNPGTEPVRDDVKVTARFVRVTATRLAERQRDYIFAMSELRLLDAAGDNVALDRPVTAFDSIEAPIRWRKQNLVDGVYPSSSGSAEKLAELTAKRSALVEEKVDAATREALARNDSERAALEQQWQQLPPQRLVYAGRVYTGNGAFRGTGADGGRPRTIHVLSRGDITSPGAEARPGTLSCLPGSPARFDLPADAPEGQRRAALAGWLASKDNPLTWRSIVNRVWQYHFGRGIVDTPNDFGRMGQLPTHPELLDWLAIEFRDGDQSLKTLHRLMVTSATYRQRSFAPADAPGHEIDAVNSFLWRASRRRLEAEAVRDAVLAVSGKLDLTMGGPSFQDFVIEKPEHSPHYQYHLHDPEDPRTHRRSVYRFLVRSQTQPFMTVMDCADPSMQVDKRNETISPLQSLAMLNNPLMMAMAKHFAARVAGSATSTDEQIVHAFRLALARSPTDEEQTALTAYTDVYGLPNTCRVIFNLNEFLFVD